VNDWTGTSATLTYTANDEDDVIYTYYRKIDDSDWTLADETRTGSGSVQITGLSVAVTDFYGVASQSGSPVILQSAPSNLIRISVKSVSPSAATDNIKVAVKTMKATAVYWSQAGLSVFGKPTWNEPVEIACRWEDAKEEFINPNGEVQVSNAKLIVDRDLVVKGVIWMGELDDVFDTDEPKNNEGAWEIIHFKKTPSFKGNKYLREVYL